jgi:hypothetical protein
MVNVAVWGKPLSGTDKGQYRPVRSGDTATDESGGALATGSAATEGYLDHPVFNVVSTSGVTADEDYPSFAGDFEHLVKIETSVVNGRADVAFEGRLASGQTLIKNLKIGIKGALGLPDYKIKVYAEGSGGTPVYDSGLLLAPVSLTETTILDSSLSAQPTGSKRFFVVVEAHLAVAGEVLYVSYPYVRQE